MLVSTISAVPPLAGTSATTMPSAMRAMVFPERTTTLSPKASCPLLTAAGHPRRVDFTRRRGFKKSKSVFPVTRFYKYARMRTVGKM